jgi:hypothetical protein
MDIRTVVLRAVRAIESRANHFLETLRPCWQHREEWIHKAKRWLFALEEETAAHAEPPAPPIAQETRWGSILFGAAFDLIALTALLLVLYFHVPAVRSMLSSLPSAFKTGPRGEKLSEGEHSEPTKPDFRVVLPEPKRKKVRHTMEAWLRVIRPELGGQAHKEQLAMLRTIIGYKVEMAAFKSDFVFGDQEDSPFTTDITAACIAGRRKHPHLILTVGTAIAWGEGYSFAVSWQDGLYEVQQLNEDAHGKNGPDIVEEGIAELGPVDFDGDGVTEAVLTWRVGSGAYLHITVHKLLPDSKWRRVWSFDGAYQGYVAVNKPDDSKVGGLAVFNAVSDDHDWAPKPYLILEYRWDRKLGTLTEIRKRYTDHECDPQELVGPVGPFGMPLTFEIEPLSRE